MTMQGWLWGTRSARIEAVAPGVCSILVLALGCSIPAHASNPQIPDWAINAASTAKGDWGDAKAVVLLQDTLLTVQSDGKAIERNRFVVKILRPQGRSEAIPAIGYSKDQKLLSFHVWSIGPDGHHYAMKDSEYVEEGTSGNGILYDDERVKTASPPGADPGGSDRLGDHAAACALFKSRQLAISKQRSHGGNVVRNRFAARLASVSSLVSARCCICDPGGAESIPLANRQSERD